MKSKEEVHEPAKSLPILSRIFDPRVTNSSYLPNMVPSQLPRGALTPTPATVRNHSAPQTAGTQVKFYMWFLLLNSR